MGIHPVMVKEEREGWRALGRVFGTGWLMVAGCGGEKTGPDPGGAGTVPSGSDLTGLWRFGFYVGTQDDFSTYELKQVGTSLTGGHCQTSYVASDAGADFVLASVDCETNSITGTFADPALQLEYDFVEGGQSYVTTFQGTASADGGRLSSTGHSTKCNCDFEFRAARQVLGQPSPQLWPPPTRQPLGTT